MPYSIVFMGTPDFAVPTLKALHDNGERIALVVTQPDRPKGRGRKIVVSPVKAAAVELGYNLEQPQSIYTEAFYTRVASIKPDFFVVVAFGQFLNSALLNIPQFGAVNVHASLLPAYRGAAPIQWAIIKGERVSGVTTMMMDRGVDTGDILLTAQESIMPEDTAADLHDRLAVKGADLLIRTLKQLKEGMLTPVPQDNSLASYAPLLKKSDGQINWHLPSAAIDCFVRGMSPWPGAYTFINKRRLKIFTVRPIIPHTPKAPGTVLDSFADELWIATQDGGVAIVELQSESGKRMPANEFLKGHPLPSGSVVG